MITRSPRGTRGATASAHVIHGIIEASAGRAVAATVERHIMEGAATMTTLTARDRREYLAGAWTLESYQNSKVDGSNVLADRAPFALGNLHVDDDELATAARGYLAHAGRTDSRRDPNGIARP